MTEFSAVKQYKAEIKQLKKQSRPYLTEIRRFERAIIYLRANLKYEQALAKKDNQIRLLKQELKNPKLFKKESPFKSWRCPDCIYWSYNCNEVVTHVKTNHQSINATSTQICY